MASIVALAFGGSGALLWRHSTIARERDVEDARMQADFANGDVHVVDGWMDGVTVRGGGPRVGERPPPQGRAVIQDLARANPGEISCDVCVIGSGPAGLAVADVLTSAGRRVAVLESGGIEPEQAPQDLNGGERSGFLDDLTGSRPRALGGASRVWAGHCGPLDADDFREESWSRSLGWPIAQADLDTHYLEAFRFLGMDPSLADPEGADGPLPRPPGLHLKLILRHPIRLGNRRSAWAAEAEGLTIWLHATAVGTVVRRRRVEGVVARSLAGEELVVRAGAVVVGAGGLENPRLLLWWLRQGTLPAEPSAADRIGRFFCIHPHLDHGALLLAGEAAANPWTVTHDVGQGVTRSTAFQIDPERRREEGLIKVLFRHEDRPADNDAAVRGERALGIWHERDTVLMERLFLQTSMPMSPSNRVSLGQARDELGVPRIRVSVTWEPWVFENLRRSLELYVTAMGVAGYGRVRFDLATLQAYATGRRFPWGGHHFMCATRMAARPDEGVVDPQLRLFGCDNLYVVGASSFGAPGAINPTLTLTALAHRLGHHLTGVL